MGPEVRSTTRVRLLEAATAVFAERGFRGATLRQIAERAGANLAAANYYFRSKERLYLEVARQQFEALEARIEREGGSTRPEDVDRLPRAGLVALLRSWIETAVETLLEEPGHHGTLMVRELAEPSGALPQIVQRSIDPLRHRLERVVTRLAPELSPAEVERCTRSIVAQAYFYRTHRAALLLLLGRDDYPRGFAREIADHIAEFSLGGIERVAARRRAARPEPVAGAARRAGRRSR